MQRRGWKRPPFADLKCLKLERQLKREQRKTQKGESNEVINTHVNQEARHKSG